MDKISLFKQIREVVKQIPKGNVLTYGDVAKIVGITDARKVGWAVYGNQDKNIPCHRVVAKDGSLAEKFSLGGWKEQKLRLLEDGTSFISEKIVDLKKCRWAYVKS